MATPKNNSGSDPDIYVSLKESKPNETNADYAEFSFGFDMVVVKNTNFTNDQPIYIAVKCASSKACDYSILAVKTERYTLAAGKRARLTFLEHSSESVTFTIAEDPNAERIVISAELFNAYSLNEPFHIYANKGTDEPSSSGSHLTATTSWFDGKAIVISKDNTYFCTGCSYTVSIAAQKGALIAVQARVYNASSIPIELGQSINDAVPAGHSVTYELDADKIKDFDQQTLTIKLTPFSGVAVLYANRNKVATFSNDAEFKASSRGKEVLLITREHLKGEKINKLYITVHGYLTTTYKIYVSGSTGNYTNRLDIGVPENGYVKKDEIINFRLSPWGQQDANISVSLTTYMGDPDLLFKSCPKSENNYQFESDCFFTADEVSKYRTKNQSGEYPMFLYSNKGTGEDSFTFHHDNKACGESNSTSMLYGTCQYVVAVINSNVTDEAQFTLTASAPRDSLKLKEGIPIRSYIEQAKEEYYMFSIVDDSNIQSVSFQVTPISGIVNVYASTKNSHPDMLSHEKVTYLNDPIIFEKEKDEPFSHVFYVTVKGHTASTFSVLATVNYDETVNKTNETLFAPIKLSEGEPQKVTLASNQVKFFQFTADFSDNSTNNTEKSVRIILQPTQGRFNFYVNDNGTLPSNTQNQYQSFYHRLVINTTNKGMVTYYVAVYPAEDSSYNSNSTASTTPTDLSFTLTYITSKTLIWLRAGQIYTDSVEQKRRIFFRYEVDPNAGPVRIMKSGDNGLVNLEGGVNIDIFSSDKEKNKSVPLGKKIGTEYIVISKEDIAERCNPNDTTTRPHNFFNRRCFLTLNASTNAEGRILFSILIEQGNERIELQNGVALTLPVPAKGAENAVSIYYTPTSTNETVEIVANSPYHKLAVTAKVVSSNVIGDNDNDTKKTEISEAEEFKPSALEHHTANTIILSPKNLTSCVSTNCVVILTVKRAKVVEDSDENKNEPKIPFEETFSIIVASGIVPLTMGHPFESSVGDKQYKYFTFEVTNETATLLISVTPLSDGDPDVFVSYGEFERPTSEDYKFTSQTLAGEQLELSNEDILPKTSMEGVWVVGVYGYKQCRFQITVVTESEKIVYLYNGIPQDIHVKAGKYVYFKHLNFRNAIDINLMTDFGNGVIYVNKYDSNQEILTNLPTSSVYQASSRHDNSRERIRIFKKNDTEDISGYYLIGVLAQNDLDFHGTILISSPGESINMQAGKTFFYSVDENESQDFVFQSYGLSNESIVDLSVVIYSGHTHVWIDHFPAPTDKATTWTLDCNPYGRTEENGLSTFTISLNETEFEEKYKDKSKTKNVEGEEIQAQESTYYIRVHGGIKSKFSIVATIRDANITLGDGYPTPAFTPPKQTSNFVYYSQSESESRNDRIKVMINVFETELDNHKSVTTWLPTYKVYTSNLEKGVDSILKEQEVYRVSESTGKSKDGHLKAQATFSVARDEGLYRFAIYNPHAFILNYTITIQDLQPIKLTLNQTQMSRIDVGSSDIFEVYINNRSTVLINVLTCFGRVEVATTQKYGEVLENNFGPALLRIDTHLTGMIPVVEEGPLFIRVRGLDGFIDDDRDPSKEALYKIKVTVLDEAAKTNSYLDAFYLGNTTIISEEAKQDFLNVSWHHVNFVNTQVKSLLKNYKMDISYKLVLGDDPIMVESMALCDVEPHDGGQFKGRGKAFVHPGDPVNITASTYKHLNMTFKYFSTRGEEHKYSKYAVVVATVHGRNISTGKPVWKMPLRYDLDQLRLNNATTTKSSGIVMFFMIACVVGLIAVIVALVWYYRRFKIMEKLLNYEMQDIRNVASIGDSSRRANQYTGLIGQNVDTA